MPNYSEEELKAAFWKTFHKEGEVFFDYMQVWPDKEINDSEVAYYWQEFLDKLKEN